MRVESLDFRTVELPRRERFTIATGSSDFVRTAIVTLTVEGASGIGAGAANSVTGETLETIVAALAKLRPALVGRNVSSTQVLHEAMDRALPGNTAAKAGIDIAFHDALARGIGKSVCRMLGGADEPVLTDMTLGIMPADEAVAKAKTLSNDFRALKLKVGTNLEQDIERVRAVREAVGETMRIRCDANQGYDYDRAMRFAEAAAELDVEFVEQPVDAEDIDLIARVANESPVPIMADESVKSMGDYRALLEKGLRHFNIKLMKCGGIRPACKIVDLLKEHDAKALVGCMGESTVSIAGALHFASANSHVVKWADLDSQFMLARDVCGPLDFRDGMLRLKGPGTGVEMR